MKAAAGTCTRRRLSLARVDPTTTMAQVVDPDAAPAETPEALAARGRELVAANDLEAAIENFGRILELQCAARAARRPPPLSSLAHTHTWRVIRSLFVLFARLLVGPSARWLISCFVRLCACLLNACLCIVYACWVILYMCAK